jgi:tetratricopeptide (TPR) repeat protein
MVERLVAYAKSQSGACSAPLWQVEKKQLALQRPSKQNTRAHQKHKIEMTDEKDSKETAAAPETSSSDVSSTSECCAGSVIAPGMDLKAELQGPSLIDDELTQQLIERGAQDWPAVYAVKFAWILAFIMPPVFLTTFFGFPFFSTFFAIFFLAWLTGTVMAHQVTTAMRHRHYARVVRLLPRTLYWTTMWYPYTHNSHLAATDAFVRLLMLEGRFVEFQAVTLYSWGLIEPQARWRKKSPKNWGVANNLAVALLSQWKFEEAAEVFRDLLKRPADKRAEAILLNNLSLCLVRMGQIEEADKTLAEAIKKASPRVRQYIGWRMDFIKASIETERENLAEAEQYVEKARDIAIRFQDNLECQPRCDALMGRVRAKQNRMEEAELYYKNAIDAMSAANNPSYIALAVYTLEFAELLQSQGKTEPANAQREKAQAFRDLNLLNELKTVEAIKARVQQKKPIIIPMALCNLAERDVYVEQIPDFAIPVLPDPKELSNLLETKQTTSNDPETAEGSGQ